MRSGPEATARFGAFELKVSCDDRLAERKQQSARHVRAILASRIDLGFELSRLTKFRQGFPSEQLGLDDKRTGHSSSIRTAFFGERVGAARRGWAAGAVRPPYDFVPVELIPIHNRPAGNPP